MRSIICAQGLIRKNCKKKVNNAIVNFSKTNDWWLAANHEIKSDIENTSVKWKKQSSMSIGHHDKKQKRIVLLSVFFGMVFFCTRESPWSVSGKSSYWTDAWLLISGAEASFGYRSLYKYRMQYRLQYCMHFWIQICKLFVSIDSFPGR